MSDYIFPCPNNCGCERIRIEGNGYPWDDDWDQYQIVGHQIAPFLWIRVCIGCKLPADNKNAAILNKHLGNSLDDIKVDDDFLDLLNGIE